MAVPARKIVLALPVLVHSSEVGGATAVAANPIRKVVTMLQTMQKKVEAEAEKEKELYDKFMCYCKNSGGDLSQSVQSAETRIPQLGADIEEAKARKAQTEEDLKNAQVDRSAAKAAMAEATSVREKEHAAYLKESTEMKTNLDAMGKAITAIANGMAGGFLQTQAAQVVKKIALNQDMADADRQDLMAFMSGGQGEEYIPASGEIVGILKTMESEMAKDLAEVNAAEESAVKAFEDMMAAKKKEVDALTAAIEEKMSRVGELGVEIVQMQNDLTDTEAALIEDQKFLADLEKDCATKQDEWAEVVKMRQQELVALADTIKILNDDDALELFKKTLSSASASFVQVKADATYHLRDEALSAIRQAQQFSVVGRPQMDFIALAIQGKKIGFEKVIKMIDEMVQTLVQEQLDDDHKKEYCAMQLDQSDDKKKALEVRVSNLDTTIENAKEGIAKLTDEIDALEDGIKALDKQVTEATEQRQDEHKDFNEAMASDSAAKELLEFAKNRLNKFYNPKLYKAPEEAPEFVQISSHVFKKDDPGPPPEAPSSFKKKGEESAGVISMINLLIQDLDKDMTEAETVEKNAQKNYEAMMSDSSEKRTTDSKALTEKTATKASLQADLETAADDKAASTRELMAVESYIAQLHSECDWLLKYFDMRKEARDGEVDSLKKAKAVLSGADFSLLQTKFLARP
jgi:predicted  nucleic acid-binding Zn-ribbon protein